MTAEVSEPPCAVAVAGGGPVGLVFALSLAEAQPHIPLRIAVHDHRWCKTPTGNGLQWKKEQSNHIRRSQVVTIESSIWTVLPRPVQDILFGDGSFDEVWPVASVQGNTHSFPRNVSLQVMEDRLLEVVQSERYKDVIVLKTDLVFSDLYHFLVIADGDTEFIASQAPDKIFGKPNFYDDIDSQVVLGAYFDNARTFSQMNAVVLSMAQKRFFVNSLSSSSGWLQMYLSDAEANELDVIPSVEREPDEVLPCIRKRCAFYCDMDLAYTSETGQSRFKCVLHDAFLKPAQEKSSLLWPRFQEGLSLFGIPRDCVQAVCAFRIDLLNWQAYYGELTSQRTPSSVRAMPHPWAFFIGNAANSLQNGAGQGLHIGWEMALSLAQSIHYAWVDGTPTDAEPFEPSVFTIATRKLQFGEAEMHSKIKADTRNLTSLATRINTALKRSQHAGGEEPRKNLQTKVKHLLEEMKKQRLPRSLLAQPPPSSATFDSIFNGLSNECLHVLDQTGLHDTKAGWHRNQSVGARHYMTTARTRSLSPSRPEMKMERKLSPLPEPASRSGDEKQQQAPIRSPPQMPLSTAPQMPPSRTAFQNDTTAYRAAQMPAAPTRALQNETAARARLVSPTRTPIEEPRSVPCIDLGDPAVLPIVAPTPVPTASMVGPSFSEQRKAMVSAPRSTAFHTPAPGYPSSLRPPEAAPFEWEAYGMVSSNAPYSLQTFGMPISGNNTNGVSTNASPTLISGGSSGNQPPATGLSATVPPAQSMASTMSPLPSNRTTRANGYAPHASVSFGFNHQQPMWDNALTSGYPSKLPRARSCHVLPSQNRQGIGSLAADKVMPSSLMPKGPPKARSFNTPPPAAPKAASFRMPTPNAPVASNAKKGIPSQNPRNQRTVSFHHSVSKPAPPTSALVPPRSASFKFGSGVMSPPTMRPPVMGMGVPSNPGPLLSPPPRSLSHSAQGPKAKANFGTGPGVNPGMNPKMNPGMNPGMNAGMMPVDLSKAMNAKAMNGAPMNMPFAPGPPVAMDARSQALAAVQQSAAQAKPRQGSAAKPNRPRDEASMADYVNLLRATGGDFLRGLGLDQSQIRQVGAL